MKRLYVAAKEEDAGALVTYVTYPSTEYLDLPFIDLFTSLGPMSGTRGGALIEDWKFGLTRSDRSPKAALAAVQRAFTIRCCRAWLERRLSLVICSYNGARTLQEGKDIVWQGETYFWSKDREFVKFIDLPPRSGRPFELACRLDAENHRCFADAGWSLRESHDVSASLRQYHDYRCHSRVNSPWLRTRTSAFAAGGSATAALAIWLPGAR